MQYVEKMLPEIDPKFTTEEWLGQLKLGSTRVRLDNLLVRKVTTALQHTLDFFKVFVQHEVKTLSSSNIRWKCRIDGRM